MLDLNPSDGSDPVENFFIIEKELAKYSAAISDKERWLVYTKGDLEPASQIESHAAEISRRLNHEGPTFIISALTGFGIKELIQAVAHRLETLLLEEDSNEKELLIREQVHNFSLNRRLERKNRQCEQKPTDIEVHYEP